MAVVANQNYMGILKGIPLFSSLTDEEMSAVINIVTEKYFRKNSVILAEDEANDYMYIVFNGRLKVVQISAEGKEQILVIRKKGDYFGEMSILDGKTQPATVIAMEDSTVGLISRMNFESFLLKNEKVLQQLIYMLCERLRESWFMLRVLSFDDAENRVRAVLNHVGSLYGVKDTRGVIIPVKLTHQEIADYASLARETVSRLLSRFCQADEIEILENRNIVLKPTFAASYSQSPR